jgi:hypothetical protein
MAVEVNPFTRMIEAGNRLIEAQRLEDQIGKDYAEHRTQARLETLKAARHDVERLAQEYLATIRGWRESLESEYGLRRVRGGIGRRPS